MDEEATPPPEPVTTPVVSADASTGQATPDPLVTDTPAVEPPQVEPVQTTAEPVAVAETPQIELILEPLPTTPETPTPQMEGNEALPEITLEPTPMVDTPSAEVPTEAPQQEAPTPAQSQLGTNQPEIPPPASPMPAPAQVITPPPPNILKLLLTKANLTIKLRKQKKLLKVMTLFAKKSHITNDDVEKLLHVSDATALRYLTQLKKENKIIQIGKTGQGVTYTKR